MNKREKNMCEILRRLTEDFSVVSVKAEFEAEGTRTEEFMRLLDISRSASANMALKIGGAEAIRDLIDAKRFGVETIVAPMVESPYALSKFIAAKNKIFDSDEKRRTSFLFNLETITAFENFDSLITLCGENNELKGCVFGRVDFAGSLGASREIVESDKIGDYILQVAKKSLDSNTELVVGGAIGVESISQLKRIKDVKLDRFETRKIIFSSALLEQSDSNIENAFKLAGQFELLWLENKRDYYISTSEEDSTRIEMLCKRWLS